MNEEEATVPEPAQEQVDALAQVLFDRHSEGSQLDMWDCRCVAQTALEWVQLRE